MTGIGRRDALTGAAALAATAGLIRDHPRQGPPPAIAVWAWRDCPQCGERVQFLRGQVTNRCACQAIVRNV